MKTNKDQRLVNARILQVEAGGQKAMIEKTGRSQSQISQIMGENASKPIGDSIARDLERVFDKPEGWLDQAHHGIEGAINISLQSESETEYTSAGKAAALAIFEELSEADPNYVAEWIIEYLPKLPKEARVAIAQGSLSGLLDDDEL